MNLPVEVLDAVREGRCVLFAGPRFAGEAAEAAGRPLPDDRALAKELGWRPPKRLPGMARRRKGPVVPSIMEGAARYEQEHGREALVARLREVLAPEGIAPTDAHRRALRRFDRIFTTAWDDLFERAAEEEGVRLEVRHRGDPDVEAPEGGRLLYRLRGSFAEPDTLVATRADLDARPFDEAARRAIRKVLRREVVFFVGYKPDEEGFESLWADLTACYGGELPRCHMAVAQGRIDDYLWQKWVWRGLLMFTADPGECLEELERRLEADG